MPSRLVAIDTTVRNEPDDSAYLDVLDWHAQATTVEHIAAYATAAVTLTGRGEAASIPMAVGHAGASSRCSASRRSPAASLGPATTCTAPSGPR